MWRRRRDPDPVTVLRARVEAARARLEAARSIVAELDGRDPDALAIALADLHAAEVRWAAVWRQVRRAGRASVLGE